MELQSCDRYASLGSPVVGDVWIGYISPDLESFSARCQLCGKDRARGLSSKHNTTLTTASREVNFSEHY
ncbi:hypothetical protein PTI98_011966 [Pleurotus ostreatus]|nr:hypothetical protein PTI98_011966 [Pleurotus ostreatus]